MNPLSFLIANLFLVIFRASAQSTSAPGDPNSQDAASNFQPSLAVVVGVLCIMFSATFILLIYAKFCYRGSSAGGDLQNRPGLVRSASRFSGIDKTVIESLPFFRFSSLKGSREGLECAVCLSKFEDIEILRLLPNCKHAFHINCVDQWLEKHSSCPLCRRKVNADDPTIFTYSNSMRSLWNPSEPRQDSNIELFVQREETRQGSSRFSIGSSFRKVEKANNKEKESLIQEAAAEHLHNFNHKIIVSDVVFQNRWSNVSSSDLMFLNSEMLNDLSSNRFSSLDINNGQFTNTGTIEDDQIVKIKEELEIKRLFENKISTINKNSPSTIPSLPSTSDSKNNSIPDTPKIIDSSERRSVSEIVGFSRFRSLGIRSKIKESSSSSEDRQRQLWLPIARKTVQWFANREMRSHQTENTRQKLDV